jgi:hypothetical protein
MGLGFGAVGWTLVHAFHFIHVQSQGPYWRVRILGGTLCSLSTSQKIMGINVPCALCILYTTILRLFFFLTIFDTSYSPIENTSVTTKEKKLYHLITYRHIYIC